MIDAAKPTPGPWYFCPYPAGNGGFVYAGGPGGPSICDMSQYDLPEQNGEFIAEAGTVYHETNLTPRQLVERVRELEAVRDNLNAGIYQLYDYAINRGNDDDFSLQISILIRQLTEFSFAKHGEEV